MRMSSTRIVWICIGFVASFFIGSCATTSQSPRVHPVFDYTPEQEDISEDRSVTFAVVGSSFSILSTRSGIETPIPLFEQFSSSMADDFGEILTARGYTWRGPFRTFDEMTFPDKEGSNLILAAEVNLDYDIGSMKLEQDLGSLMLGPFSKLAYKASGSIIVAGRINIVVSESVTNERMWTKSVEVTPITVHLDGEPSYEVNPAIEMRVTFSDVLANDNAFYSQLGKKLEELYEEVMHRTYGYLDPREMDLVNRKADGLREKKVY